MKSFGLTWENSRLSEIENTQHHGLLKIVTVIIVVVIFCSLGTVEYRETITIINRVLEEHKSTMQFAKPDLDWCDLAVQVCVTTLLPSYSQSVKCTE